MAAVSHVDDIFAIGEETRYDQFGRDVNQIIPFKKLGELRWYSGCFYERDWEKGMMTISQQTFAEQLASEYGVESYGKSVPLSVGTKLANFDKNEAPGHWPFNELVGFSHVAGNSDLADISNPARAVARYCSAPKYVHWRAALGIIRVCETDERIWHNFSERYSRKFELAGFC